MITMHGLGSGKSSCIIDVMLISVKKALVLPALRLPNQNSRIQMCRFF